MIALSAANFTLIIITLFLPNEFLKWNSFIFFGLQSISLLPYLFRRVRFAHQILIPSLFMLTYFLINQTLGSYLIPRGFGWNKDFMLSLLHIENYAEIISYLMTSNLILFFITKIALDKPQPCNSSLSPAPLNNGNNSTLTRDAALLSAFFGISILDVFGTFALQTAIILIHLSDPKLQTKKLRFFFYTAYAIAMIAFNYQNKREIIMALLLILFIESSFHKTRIEFTAKKISIYLGSLAALLLFVIIASILRGYGGFTGGTIFDAIMLIPQYVGSERFLDGLTDNLELSYNYAAAVIPIDYAINGKIDIQYGQTILKFFFMPIPREIFPDKPESVIMLFTKAYDPLFYDRGGSYPVNFSSELFINFNIFGWLFLPLLMIPVNSIYTATQSSPAESFKFYSCTFLIINFFMFIRGSGAELWIFNYLVALLVIAPYSVLFSKTHTQKIT